MAAKTGNQGAERVARRTRQAANKTRADKDAQLTPKAKGPEKDAAVAEAAARNLAKFGDGKTSARKTQQAANKTKAETELVSLAAPVVDERTILAGVAPGQTPTLRQLRLLSKQAQRPINAEAHEIAVAAGRMVKDTLLGRKSAVPMAVRRQRRVDQSQRQLATANAAE